MSKANEETNQVEPVVILSNKQGVKIVENITYAGHLKVVGASCTTTCKADLIIAPKIFMSPHEKGNPVIICTEYGQHAYMFNDLLAGPQAI